MAAAAFDLLAERLQELRMQAQAMQAQAAQAAAEMDHNFQRQAQEMRETLGAQVKHLEARLSVSWQGVRGQGQGGAGAGDEGSDKGWGGR